MIWTSKPHRRQRKNDHKLKETRNSKEGKKIYHVKASSVKSTTAPFPILSLVAARTSSANAPGPQTETTVAPTRFGRISSSTTSGRHRPESICTVADGEIISAGRRGFDTNSLTTRISRRHGMRRIWSIHWLTQARWSVERTDQMR